MNKDYQKLIDEIADKVIKSLKTGEVKKTSWESIGKIDHSFGGSLKSFSNMLGLENIDIIIGEFKKGEGLKKHYHKAPTEEVYYILEGEAEVNIKDMSIIAKKGDILSVPPNTIHWPINHKDEICKILFILAPIEKESAVIIE